jgi:hypothetical protein
VMAMAGRELTFKAPALGPVSSIPMFLGLFQTHCSCCRF